MPVRFLHLADTHVGARHPGRGPACNSHEGARFLADLAAQGCVVPPPRPVQGRIVVSPCLERRSLARNTLSRPPRAPPRLEPPGRAALAPWPAPPHEKWRPGDPFVRNLRRALRPAREGRVDLVLHGGDLFHRSRPPPRRLAEAAEALVAAAEGGAEVVIVPGNHERSVIPARLLLGHPRIHILEVARCVRLDLDGLEVAVFGFPFVRRNPRARFEEGLGRTGWPRERAEVNVLLCHLTLDGATVGPAGYTFRHGPDVIPREFIPADLDYAALGHIHRHQFLPHPRNPTLPLAYPGSTERTSRAERHERKGFLAGEFRPDGTVRTAFRALPADPLPPAERRRNWTVLSR